MNNDFERPEDIIPEANVPENVPETAPEPAAAPENAYAAYGGYMQNTPTPPAPKKKSWWTGGKIVAFIAIIVGALMIGAILGFTAGFAVASLDSIDLPDFPETPEDIMDMLPSDDDDSKIPTVDPDDLPSTLPELGGKAPVIKNEINPVPEIAEAVSPSVVVITTYNKALNDEQKEIFTPVGYSSGTILSKDGYIATNHHVIDSGSSFVVTLGDGSEHDAIVVGSDPYLDIAVIKIAPNASLVPIAISDSDTCRVGDYAIAIGNPMGAGELLPGTVTVGHVSAVNREMTFNDFRQKFIQIDTPINPGNSGGPIVNAKGECIGITTWKSLLSGYDDSGEGVPTEGVGFAIPINSAMDSIESIILTGERQRAGLGITFYEFNEEAAEAAGLDVTGIEIAGFLEGSPCEEAGIEVGDIISHMNGKAITDTSAFSAEVQSMHVGDEVTFTVYREGTGTFEVKVTLMDLNK